MWVDLKMEVPNAGLNGNTCKWNTQNTTAANNTSYLKTIINFMV